MKFITSLFLLTTAFFNAQTIQTVNSGSLIASNSSISIGEIFVTPQTPNLSSASGIIGILTQVNNQNLEIKSLDLSKTITVYPNPTASLLTFNNT